MPFTPTAHSRLLALLGDPVSHSLSPVLHNAALRALDLDATYVALRCTAADCPGLLTGIARANGAGNITVPHKLVAARTIERPTGEVTRTGACNTYWLEGGLICGDNTDVEGFRRAAEALLGDLSGARVLLLGAGGAARAVLAALLDVRAERVVVQARNASRARALLELDGASGTQLLLGDPENIEHADLVVNATPLGLHGQDEQPLPIDAIPAGAALLDLVYLPAETTWVRAARKAGFRAADGREMLLQQAAAAFRRWWQQDAPIDVMREALEATRRA